MTAEHTHTLDVLNQTTELAFREPSILGGKYSDSAAPRFEMLAKPKPEGIGADSEPEENDRRAILPLAKSERERGNQLLNLLAQSGIEAEFVSSEGDTGYDRRQGLIISLDQPDMEKRLADFLANAQEMRAEAVHTAFTEDLARSVALVPERTRPNFLHLAHATLGEQIADKTGRTPNALAQLLGQYMQHTMQGLSPEERLSFLVEVKRQVEQLRHQENDAQKLMTADEEKSGQSFTQVLAARRNRLSAVRQPE